MIRKLWRKKAVLVILIIFCLFVLNQIFMDRTSEQGELTVRQILQVNDPTLTKDDLAVQISDRDLNKKLTLQGNDATKKPPLPPGIQKPSLPPPAIKAAPTPPLALPSGSPRLFGDFPENEAGLPGITNYLPHLRGNPPLLSPAIALSKGKTNVSIVIGIPSIRRPVSTYLYDTLKSLVDGMNPDEKADTLIIVCINEPWNMTYVDEVKQQLHLKFPDELGQGLVEMIVPKPGFYPSLDNLPPTLGDNPERMK
ncbi:alpha-1,3-mannosyl-glycoprotein 4-beta-n-acetylglucosaminyltransferase b-like [Plakobranchus ocellatus]|uniref:Alpha-1,3-mannosyl-glycoprotein 4-beta-n-acetylglucosaminyltransferase b-like n=1 Tax=Plakobranchus ocellatus TaxID=259542 RepID=A0AAV4AQV3_9GAST|nr:alpha-1,3-mannosyl-glycoprotein 4-beta-n-acetylglucosaminyltransferase b-like [Plakobranchus ocellatus]